VNVVEDECRQFHSTLGVNLYIYHRVYICVWSSKTNKTLCQECQYHLSAQVGIQFFLHKIMQKKITGER